MQMKLILSICTIYQIICRIAADSSNDSRSNEDNYALRVSSVPPENSSKNNPKGKLPSRRLALTDEAESTEDNDEGPKKEKSPRVKKEDNQYQFEQKPEVMSNLFGANQHYSYPKTYLDFGRRFVLQYPYKEVLDVKDDKNTGDYELIPIKAPPEVVLAVAERGAFLEAMSPRKPFEETLNKESLRSGNYWNGVWREEVDPKILRTQEKKADQPKPVIAKVMPGSNLHKLISELQQISPRLVYVMNTKKNV